MNKAQHLPPIVIPEDHYERLAFIAIVSRMGRRPPPTGAALAHELDRARIVPPGEVPGSVVTMGSTVAFRDDDTGRASTATIVFPGEDTRDRGLLSVLTPLGTALIGLSEGQSIRWKSAVGDWRSLTVVRVSQASPTSLAEDGCTSMQGTGREVERTYRSPPGSLAMRRLGGTRDGAGGAQHGEASGEPGRNQDCPTERATPPRRDKNEC
ncbi:nucleoside diphosphate kinase regulator [Faunimonas sp. B44]|uniref:nucleoside diphosphate kinase regulator n=1 Tax=Faunimonas sp. B44 TaxID=3461493 RepID=UPI004044B079